jgi:hypothetical protein
MILIIVYLCLFCLILQCFAPSIINPQDILSCITFHVDDVVKEYISCFLCEYCDDTLRSQCGLTMYISNYSSYEVFVTLMMESMQHKELHD